MDFLILPDHPGAGAALDGLDLAGARTLTHRSGRPWLVGWWAEADLRLVDAGPNRLAVIGRTRLPDGALEGLGDLADLDVLARRLPGSVHLVASFDGLVRAQGSVTTARQVFTAELGGISVGASATGPLAALTGAVLDDTALALRLLVPTAPWPLSLRGIWRGVRATPPGHWLRMDRAGRARFVRWWQPPPADLPLAEAALGVREALTEALAVRADRGTISADLSGGLDSTSVCFLAAAADADLVTFHATPLDAANTDAVWAARAAAALPGVHRVLPAQRSQNWFDADPAAHAAVDAGEGPPHWGAGLAHLADLAAAAAREGSTLHLMGIGGDELFGAVPAALWSLARARPLTALALADRYRKLNRWRVGDLAAGLLDRGSFAASLRRAARDLTAPPPRPPALDLGWVVGLRMPPWATPEAVDLVRSAILAEDAEPLDADRTRHQVLDYLAYEGGLIRQVRRGLAATGVQWDAPLLDHRVVEAALAVRIEDRARPGRFKPVLTAALRGIVPAEFLDRRTKGEFSAELYEGLDRNRDRFLALCADLRLAERGLVDAAVLRTALRSPAAQGWHLTPLENTVSVEGWLRAAPTPVGGPR